MIGSTAKRLVLAASSVAMLMGAPAIAQNLTVGSAWNGSYGFPSPNERSVRLNTMVTQRQLESGAFDSGAVTNITTNTTNNYDQSAGDTNVTAAEGATVDLQIRTSADSGDTTSTSTIGSQNTTNSTITVEGSDNLIEVLSSSDSIGCQDGSITTSMNSLVGGLDISANASASGASASATGSSGSSTVTSGPSNCN